VDSGGNPTSFLPAEEVACPLRVKKLARLESEGLIHAKPQAAASSVKREV
jgi:hypothetical protein